MKRLMLIALLAMAGPAVAEECECQKTIVVRLRQSHMTLNLFEHIKDSMNSVTFKLPISCKFYNEVGVGQSLLEDRFRMGSLVINGSVGKWVLEVVEK